MSFYTELAFQLFNRLSDEIEVLFPELADDLKKAGMKTSKKEYISITAMNSLLFFLVELPILSFSFGFLFKGALTSLVTAISVSIALTVFVFYLFTKYPRAVVGDRSKKIDIYLPFATLYLSTIAGTKLPLDQVFKLFGKYSSYGEITEQVQIMNKDIDVFGLDIHTALQRAIDRTPSTKFKEMLYGLLSTSISGGNVSEYLREKTESEMNDYRLSINEFSKRLTIYIEVYLTAIVLGTIFFLILTSIFSGISGVGTNLILLQTLLIFVSLPLFSFIFILLVKVSSPTGE